MEAYHEKERDLLSEKRVIFFKNKRKMASVMAKPHWQNAYEILYVRSGSGQQQINSTTFEYTAGTISIIRPGDIHSTIATAREGSEIDVLQFFPDYFGEREGRIFALKSQVIEEGSKELSELFDALVKYSQDTTAEGEIVIAGTVLMICGLIMKYSRGSGFVAKTTDFVRTACKYISTADDVRLKTVASHFGYSAEHFSRKFHIEAGISYKNYCEKIKLQKIIKELEDDTLSLSEIAESLGYSDTGSFIRAFKRIYSITPHAYKKLKKSQGEC